jgi:methionyl aminopeptidase
MMPQPPSGIESEKVLDAGGGRPHGARMAITILSPGERDRMRRAGRAAAATLAYVGARLTPGMTTAEIDRLVRAHTAAQGGRPSQLGYHGFPAAVCVSRNDIVCHGVPSPHVRLADGDIVNIDITTELDGFHGDTSATFVIGDAAPAARALVELARGARDVGIAAAVPGARLGDLGAAIVRHVAGRGSIVEAYGGHGIGRAMHMDPHVPHVGRPQSGHCLREGMAFTVEPMINAGAAAIRTDADGWTVRTADGALSAQFEHTVLIGPHGAEITTLDQSLP